MYPSKLMAMKQTSGRIDSCCMSRDGKVNGGDDAVSAFDRLLSLMAQPIHTASVDSVSGTRRGWGSPEAFVGRCGQEWRCYQGVINWMESSADSACCSYSRPNRSASGH